MRDMSHSITRRAALKQISVAGAGVLVSRGIIRGQGTDITIGGQPVEIAVASLSPSTVRISVLPVAGTRQPSCHKMAAWCSRRQPSASRRHAPRRSSSPCAPVT